MPGCQPIADKIALFVFPPPDPPVHIGPFQLRNNVFVAPMAGVTDRPFRQLCKQLGAGYAVSEMAASDPRLWASEKTSRRINHDGEMAPRAVQIAGADPQMLANCARFNVERGAQIIDINMGCPVKKVCNSWCGSALLQDEKLVQAILEAVVGAVDVPVTLKFRTGWDRQHKNALRIAALAEASGIAMLTLHGRTRADGYAGERGVRDHRRGQGQRRHPGGGKWRHRLRRKRRRPCWRQPAPTRS